MRIYAQGDILFRLVPASHAKGELVKTDMNRVIFAYGEVTGHHHSVPATAGTFQWDEQTGPGMVWEVRRQTEYIRGNEVRVAD